MHYKLFLRYILIVSLLVFSSCSSKDENTIQKKKIVKLNILYKQALEKFEIGDYQLSVQLFEMVEKDYGYTEWASKSLLMRAYIYYDSGKYVQALTHLQRYQKKYSGNKNIDYVEYLIGLCLFEQINFAYLSQENTELALRQFNKVIKNFPNSKYSTDSKFKIDLIREQLAAKEIYIARYYAIRKKWIPALYRLNNIIKKYQDTIFIEEALHRVVEIYYTIGNINGAKKYASILGYNYNDSDWYKKSYAILEPRIFNLEKDKNNKSFKNKLIELIK